MEVKISKSEENRSRYINAYRTIIFHYIIC
jgi:hypothetical protein